MILFQELKRYGCFVLGARLPTGGKTRKTMNWHFGPRGFPGGSDRKASACNAGDRVLSLGWEDLLE